MSTAEIGVIGGSGFYALLQDAREVVVDTPYGAPSDPLLVGEVGGRTVAFVPRHGADHRLPPHGIPYRANLWALARLGVRQVLAPSAVGSLQAALGPGALVVPDQLVDRTTGRVQTFHDDFSGGVAHVGFADPYCPQGRATVLRLAADWPAVDGGTLVVIDGPRFSTRAESRWYAAQGWSLIGMTGHPEAVLARELGLCYTPLALVTDRDAGVEGGEAVTQEAVFAVFRENTEKMRALVLQAVAALPAEPACGCAEVPGRPAVPAL